jgi:hypothetical protein
MGVPDQYFVEKSEALDGCHKVCFTARRAKRGSVDNAHIGPEGIVNRHNCIKWFCHFLFLLFISGKNPKGIWFVR